MQTIQFKVDNNYIDFIKTLLENLTIGIKDLSIIKDTKIVNVMDKNSYFQSKEDEYIFYLVELDGELQQEKLKINLSLYKNKAQAKKWRDEIIKVLRPDTSQHPHVNKASSILHELYSEMKQNGK